MDAFNAFGHLVIGAILALLFAHTPADSVVIMMTSLLPDIDHPNSTFGRYNPLAHWGWVQHRGFSHSLIGIFLFCLPFLAFGGHAYGMAVIGYAGHVLGDVFLGLFPKKQGMPLRIW